jgi:hypothetical protein
LGVVKLQKPGTCKHIATTKEHNMSNSRFQRGHGVFNCGVCGRKTRGDGESQGCDLCGQCYELAGWDNHHNDNGSKPDADEMVTFNALLADIGKKGGDVQKVKELNDYLWEPS